MEQLENANERYRETLSLEQTNNDKVSHREQTNNTINQSYQTIDAVVDFSKQALNLYFQYANMKKIKSALDKSNYSKLYPLIKNAEEQKIHSCLIYALHAKLDKIAKNILRDNYIQNKKIDINKNNCELLKYSVYYNKPQLTIMMINGGADIHTDDDYALINYCLLKNTEIVKLLMNKGANIYARNCLALIQAAGTNNLEILKLLLEQMKKIVITELETEKCKPSNFDVALISATLNGDIEAVKLLLLAGADPTINNSEVLVSSAENGYTDIVEAYLNYGMDPNILEGTIIKKAIINNHIDTIKLLVNYQKNNEYIYDLSADDSAGLRWAAYKGHYDIVKLLLEAKSNNGKPRCDIHAENNDAYRLASKYGHTNIVNMLEQYGGNNYF